jgi:hypothetical protein
MSASIDGVATVGSAGLTPPTSGTQTVTLLPGFPTATNSMYDYYFADANTIYTVDDRNAAGAGLEKWVLSGGTWSMVYSKLAGGTTGLKSLTGYTDAFGNVVLFGATVGAQTNKLYGYADTLANTSAASVTENLLVDAATPSTFGATGTLWSLRGLALSPGTVIPEPATFSLLALACLACLPVRSRKA